jgi:effector-binding domain-containing protein
MMTLPIVAERKSTPYVAVKAVVTLPFDDQLPGIMEKLFGYVTAKGLEETGPVFFKHNIVDMPTIEMEFGVPVNRVVEGHDECVSGVLPAGRYAEITYFGPYDDLMTVNGVLIGWARHAGLDFDARQTPGGEWFANRLEVYHNSPEEEPDPQKWQTTVAIKLKD